MTTQNTINKMNAEEKRECEAWLDSLNQVENEEICATCGGVNFKNPPEYNYEAYEQVICPECGGIDWKWFGEN